MYPDILVVANPADAVGSSLTEAAEKSGRRTLQLDYPEASRLFTITGGQTGERVEPDIPMFVRAPLIPTMKGNEDALFQLGECLSTVWAAAALCASPVLGRPGLLGFGGKCTGSAVVTEFRGGYHEGRTEVVSRELPAPEYEEQEWWTQSLATFATA